MKAKKNSINQACSCIKKKPIERFIHAYHQIAFLDRIFHVNFSFTCLIFPIFMFVVINL